MKKQVYLIVLLVVCFFTKVNAQNFLTHTVKENETITSIATTYKISKLQIYELNPDAKKGLKVNDVLIIPNGKVAAATTPIITKTLKEFKLHNVKRKETLYSLSKLYNISQDEIKKYNPSLYSQNLRKGDEIKIPTYTTTVVSPKVTKKDSTLQPGKYIVKPKEGKWRIAQNFKISVEELNALNPNIEVLKIGDTINVPVIKNLQTNQVNIERTYTVLPKEGFFRLKQKLGLTKEELETLNPELKESGLKVGMVLKLPELTNTYESVQEGVSIDLIKQIDSFPSKRIAFMLPFKLNEIETDSIKDTRKKVDNDKLLNLSLEFYSGVELALDSLKKIGAKLDVKVFDTKNSQSASLDFSDELVYGNYDAVIGPFMPKNFNVVAKKLQSNSIPVVSPLTKKVEVGPNVFQSRPSGQMLKDKIVNYISKDSISNIVIIYDAKHLKEKNELVRKFPNATLLASNKDKKTGEDEYFVYSVHVEKALIPGKNIVFLETEKEGFVSNVVSILNSSNNNKNKSVLLTTTDMNDAFIGDEVSNQHLAQLNFTYATIAKNYDSDAVQGFVNVYNEKYSETPSPYAIRGFDITMDVVLRLMASSSIYDSTMQFPLTSYIENKFLYTQTMTGGFQNNAVYLVKYEGLKILEVTE